MYEEEKVAIPQELNEEKKRNEMKRNEKARTNTNRNTSASASINTAGKISFHQVCERHNINKHDFFYIFSVVQSTSPHATKHIFS